MSVYSELLERVAKGAKYKINLVEKTLKIDGKEIALEGNEYDELITLDDLRSIGFEQTDPWLVLECMYSQYESSVPSKKRNGNKPYFKVKDIENLTDYDLVYGNQRNYMQAMIEGYVLLASLRKWLKMRNENHWFWQSNIFPQLIVLAEWI